MKKDMKLVMYIVVLVLVLIFGIKNLTSEKGLNISKIKDDVIELQDNKYNKENDGKLVIVKGKLNTKENKLTDNDFLVSLKDVVKMTRNVEIYRYRKNKNKVEIIWDNTSNDVERELYDKKTDTHYTNPISIVNSQTIMQDAYIGDFIVDKSIFNDIDNNKNVTKLDKNVVDKLQYLTKINNKYYIDGNYYTTVKDNEPLIGDIRVSFEYLDLNDLGNVTIVAKQDGDELSPYIFDSENNIFELYEGDLSKQDVIRKLGGTSVLSKIISIVLIIITLVLGVFVFKNDIKKIKKSDKKKHNIIFNNLKTH